MIVCHCAFDLRGGFYLSQFSRNDRDPKTESFRASAGCKDAAIRLG